MLSHAADGYVPDNSSQLAAALSSSEPISEEEHEYENLTVKSGGALIPRSSMLELNTYYKFRQTGDRLETKFRECWLSQEAHLIFAGYNMVNQGKKWKADFTKLRGVVEHNDTEHYSSEDVSSWALNDHEIIQSFDDSLTDLVARIPDAVANGEGRTFLIERLNRSQEITVTASGDVPILSEELCERLQQQQADVFRG